MAPGTLTLGWRDPPAARQSRCGGRWPVRDAETRASSQVATEYGVLWWLVNYVAAGGHAELPAEPPPVWHLGIDAQLHRASLGAADVGIENVVGEPMGGLITQGLAMLLLHDN